MLAGFGALLLALLAVGINLATDLVPDEWEDWPAYPWAVVGATVAMAVLSAAITAVIQKRAGAGEPANVQASGLSVGSNRGTVVYAGEGAVTLNTAGEPISLAKILLSVGFTGAAVGGPVILGLLNQDYVRSKPLTFALLCGLYEIAIAFLFLFASVVHSLHSRFGRQIADRLGTWLYRKLSPFTRNYLTFVKATSMYIDTQGLTTRGEFTHKLAETFVSVSLDGRAMHSASADPVSYGQPRQTDPSRSVWYWLRHARNHSTALSILGPPGSGKTTLVRHVAYTLAVGGRTARLNSAPRLIPVFASLRDYAPWTSDVEPSLIGLVGDEVRKCGRTEPNGWIEAGLRRGRLALVFDGLDEVPDETSRRRLSSWVARQQTTYPKCLFIVTSRPFGYRGAPLPNATVVQVNQFSETQIKRFVRQWYHATTVKSFGADDLAAKMAAKSGTDTLLTRLSQAPNLWALAANPLLLTMISSVHHYRGKLPGSRADLYGEICEVFLGKRHEARGVQIDMPARQKQRVLQELAFHMMEAEVRDIRSDEAHRVILNPLARVAPRVTPREFLRSVEETGGILIEREKGSYAFAHLTFQEYLCAAHIKDCGLTSRLSERVSQTWWHETVRLYAAMADATPLVDACLASSGDLQHLVLAAQCVQEGREVSPAVRARLEERLDPRPGSVEASDIRTAAVVRLLLRTNAWLRSSTGVLVADHPISNAEFLGFSARGTNGTQPPPDEEVDGVDHREAGAFCDWVTSTMSDGYSYRLPTPDEVDTYLSSVGPSAGRTASFWVSGYETKVDALQNLTSRFLARPTTYPPTKSRFPDDICIEVMASDRNALNGHLDSARLDSVLIRLWRSRLITKDGEPGDGDPRNFYLPDARLLRKWREVQSLDRERALEDLHYLSGFASGAINSVFKIDEEAASLIISNCDLVDSLLKLSDSDESMPAMARAAALSSRNAFLRAAGRVRLRRWIPGRRRARAQRRELELIAEAFEERFVELLALEAVKLGRLRPPQRLLITKSASGDRASAWDHSRDRFRPKPVHAAVKRLLDVTLATSLTVFMAPVLATISMLVWLTSTGPVLSRQTRVGRYGEEFPIVKYRTMYVHTEARMASSPHIDEQDGDLFRIRDDPRVTPVGRVLRRFSLDQLPQLINVLRGDMSLVGPRPPLPAEVAAYDSRMLQRLWVRPGLTGLWQVSGRDGLTWEEGLSLDLRYVENWSVALDIAILVRALAGVATPGPYR